MEDTSHLLSKLKEEKRLMKERKKKAKFEERENVKRLEII
jgi:hypothetical protein